MSDKVLSPSVVNNNLLRGHPTTYGSGQRQIDQCKADSAREAVAHWARVADDFPIGSVEREAIEARCGREAMRLAEILARMGG